METPLDSAASWLSSFMLSSFNMDAKFLTPAFATKVLAPLYQLVPKPKAPGEALFRVILSKRDLTVGSTVTLPVSKRVKSWTQYSSKARLRQIADDVGILGEDRVYVITGKPKNVLVDPVWLKAVQVQLKRQKDLRSRDVEEFLQINPNWQKEVVVADKTPTKAKVLYLVEY